MFDELPPELWARVFRHASWDLAVLGTLLAPSQACRLFRMIIHDLLYSRHRPWPTLNDTLIFAHVCRHGTLARWTLELKPPPPAMLFHMKSFARFLDRDAGEPPTCILNEATRSILFVRRSAASFAVPSNRMPHPQFEVSTYAGETFYVLYLHLAIGASARPVSHYFAL